MFRHSVFFDTCEVANSEETRISEQITPEDIYQSDDGETGLIEVRFFTECKLDRYDQRSVVRHASAYSLNCEE